MISIVTGGCGFIGSHIVDRLLSEGHEVRVIDNWTTGRPQNLDHQKSAPGLAIHHLDIRDIESIRPIFDGADLVFHLAAPADIVPSIQKPWEYYSSNVLGTYNVAECAKTSGVRKVVYAASSSCYGIPDEYPTNESAEIRPQYRLFCVFKATPTTILHDEDVASYLELAYTNYLHGTYNICSDKNIAEQTYTGNYVFT